MFHGDGVHANSGSPNHKIECRSLISESDSEYPPSLNCVGRTGVNHHCTWELQSQNTCHLDAVEIEDMMSIKAQISLGKVATFYNYLSEPCNIK